MLSPNDVRIIRELAAHVAEIAARPVQEEKRALWRKLNARQPVRPNAPQRLAEWARIAMQVVGG